MITRLKAKAMAADGDGAAEAAPTDRRRPRDVELERQDVEDDVDAVFSTEQHFQEHSIDAATKNVGLICDRIESGEDVPLHQLVLLSRDVAQLTSFVGQKPSAVSHVHAAAILRVVGLVGAKLHSQSAVNAVAIQELQRQLQQQAALLTQAVFANQEQLGSIAGQISAVGEALNAHDGKLREAEDAFGALSTEVRSALDELVERDEETANQLRQVIFASEQTAGDVANVQSDISECRSLVEQRLSFFSNALQAVHTELCRQKDDGVVLRKEVESSFSTFVADQLNAMTEAREKMSEVHDALQHRLTAGRFGSVVSEDATA